MGESGGGAKGNRGGVENMGGAVDGEKSLSQSLLSTIIHSHYNIHIHDNYLHNL